MRLEIGKRQLLEVGKEVVPHVVLDVPRRANENAAHEEPEHAADQPDREEGEAVLDQLGARDAARQIVDRIPQHHRRRKADAVADDDAREAEREVAAITQDVTQQPSERRHVPSI